MEPLMTVTDVARYLKVTPRTVYSFLESGELKGIKIGRSWRIKKSELERLGREPIGVSDVTEARATVAAPETKPRPAAKSLGFADKDTDDVHRLLEMIESGRNLQRYRRVFDSLPCATFIVDAAGYVVDSNEAASRLFGLSAAAMASRRVSDLPAISAVIDIESVIEKAYRQGSYSTTPKHANVETGDLCVRGVWAFSTGSDEVTVQICCDGSVRSELGDTQE
jgi:excisionase family DNA binding protein